MKNDVSILNQLDEVIRRGNGAYQPFLLSEYCGDNGEACLNAFNSLADKLPSCAEKMIETSLYTQDGLALKGYSPVYNKLANFYLSVLTASYKNLLWIAGKEAAFGQGSYDTLSIVRKTKAATQSEALYNKYLNVLIPMLRL
jgi:hypothetical protein